MSPEFIGLISTGLGETVFMVFFSTLAALTLGIPLGIILVITEKGNLIHAPKINKILGTIVNVVRSFPFIILIVILLPLSRLLIGTTLGATAAIVPLAIGSAPFISRIIENSLKEVAPGKIEASLAMGATTSTIIFKVLIPEAFPSLVRGITICVITITGFTAEAGAIAAGGLGSLAIRYGYQRFREDIMFVTVFILIIFVQSIQFFGDLVSKSINKKRFKFE